MSKLAPADSTGFTYYINVDLMSKFVEYGNILYVAVIVIRTAWVLICSKRSDHWPM